MATEAWIFVVILAAAGAAVGGYAHGKRVGMRRGMVSQPGKPPMADKANPRRHDPVINPKVAATALAITAAQGKPQKV